MNITFGLGYPMSFPNRLLGLRKHHHFTQQSMADAVGIHVNSIKKYEAGQAQPSLEVLKKIATALNVTTDSLLFEEHERGPNEDLILQFEAVSQLSPHEKIIVQEVLDGLIIKYQTRKFDSMRRVETVNATTG